ncbi:hypothetical protein ASG31_09255 [Chryseobacterium sp. Leaf404]|uniref:hypothetical protein n=1 Tax=unclassified Chryseobacterium TaxID=2593645 RepID=UPI0006FFE055|nr:MULTISPECIES: hypothetical protein [unclassified Chryseobacterium]KQT17577.1 hypothetical protein ASG31_09255 [Chryseobacterium sp. Leaf404]
MKKLFSIIIVLSGFLTKAQLAPPIQWQKTLGGTDWDQGQAVWATTDGGSILASYSPSINGDVTGNHGNGDYWVVKLDVAGNIQW